MKNMLSTYYELYPDKVYTKNQKIYFFENENKILIKEISEENAQNVKIIIEKYGNLIKKQKQFSEIINNKNGEITTKYKNKNYIVLKVNVVNKNMELEDLNSQIIKINDDMNIQKKETDKMKKEIDDLESKIIEFNNEYKIIQKTINYYIGMSENAIQMSNKINNKNDASLIINVKNLDEYDYEEINDPSNLEISSKEKCISNYLKYKIYKSKIVDDEVDKIINFYELDEIKLYMYLIYSNYYLSDVKKIIKEEDDEKILKKYIDGNLRLKKMLEKIKKKIKDENTAIKKDNFWINIDLKNSIFCKKNNVDKKKTSEF